LNRKNKIMRDIFCIFAVLFMVSILFSPCTLANQVNTNQNDNVKKRTIDDPLHFPFAIVFGKFEILKNNIFLSTLYVYNKNLGNLTMHVFAYCNYEHRWYCKSSSYFNAYRHIGFVGNHYLFAIGFGNVEVWP
jgi:hypothetical protein